MPFHLYLLLKILLALTPTPNSITPVTSICDPIQTVTKSVRGLGETRALSPIDFYFVLGSVNILSEDTLPAWLCIIVLHTLPLFDTGMGSITVTVQSHTVPLRQTLVTLA